MDETYAMRRRLGHPYKTTAQLSSSDREELRTNPYRHVDSMRLLRYAGRRIGLGWRSRYSSDDSSVGTASSDSSDDDDGKKRCSFGRGGGEVTLGVDGDERAHANNWTVERTVLERWREVGRQQVDSSADVGVDR